MKTIVADASALVNYLLHSDNASEVRAVVEHPENDVHVPALCDIEVAAALRKALLAKRIPEAHVPAVTDAYFDLPVTRHGHELLVPRILELRHTFTAYDAAYVALAEALDGELLTGDKALARAARTHVRVA